MPGWIINILLVAAGFIAGLFMSPSDLEFGMLRMIIAILLFTIIVAIIVICPIFVARIKKKK